MTRATLITVLLVRMAFAAELPRADDPTHFTPADKLAMMRLVRRVAEAKKPLPFDAATMPAKLLRSTGKPAFVSAHRAGRDPAVAVREKGTLFDQLHGAALELAQRNMGPLRDVRFKIDLVDRVAPVGPNLGFGFTGHPVLGIHGLHLRAAKKELYLLPSEALRRDLKDGEAFIRHAIRVAKLPPGRLSGVRLERFTTVSFIEAPTLRAAESRHRRGGAPGGAIPRFNANTPHAVPPADLYRGMPLVERVTPKRLLAAVEAGADYLLRMQKRDGSFHYLYHAATDRIGEGYNIVRHAGTTWSLAQAGRTLKQKRFLDGARRALDWLLGHVRSRGNIAWVEHDGRRALGSAALAVVALLEFREAAATKRHDATIRRLGRFLVFMQRPDGSFATEYDPKTHRGVIPTGHVSLYAPGEATLALVRLQRAMPDPAWQRAAAKAADFLAAKRDAWNATRGLEYVHPDSWTIMAITELHALGLARRAHADYALFLAQRIIEEQETPRTARWLDHVGAPRESPPRVTPAASRCEGLVAAWRLARRLGAHATPYRRAVLLSARFQLAHQYDAVNSYLLANPSRARGGFFSSYADHSIRIDTVQHNLSSLLGLAELLAAER